MSEGFPPRRALTPDETACLHELILELIHYEGEGAPGKSGNQQFRCQCDPERLFKGSFTRVLAHLLQIKEQGTAGCKITSEEKLNELWNAAGLPLRGSEQQ